MPTRNKRSGGRVSAELKPSGSRDGGPDAFDGTDNMRAGGQGGTSELRPGKIWDKESKVDEYDGRARMREPGEV